MSERNGAWFGLTLAGAIVMATAAACTPDVPEGTKTGSVVPTSDDLAADKPETGGAKEGAKTPAVTDQEGAKDKLGEDEKAEPGDGTKPNPNPVPGGGGNPAPGGGGNPAPGGGGKNGGARSSSGKNCCFDGEYLECPDSKACFGGFDVNECQARCNGEFDCIMDCVGAMSSAPPPTNACQKKAAPAGVTCGG